MKAILVDENSKNLYLGQADMPSISANDLLVKVKATALNRADLLQKRGLYPPPKGASPILGLEMSGVIEVVGENVQGWNVGDRVFALLPGGGYAEHVTIPASMAMPIPDHITYEEAAAIPEVFLTAYLNLFWLGQLKKDETVLIHAGASGVGTAAIQLARETGARVIVTAGSEKKRELCLSLGAKYAIDYKAGSFSPKIKEITEGKGVHLILDFIGAPYWQQNIDSLSRDGKLILIGVMGGSKLDGVDLGELLFKRIQVIGSALRSQSAEQKVTLTSAFGDFALPKFAAGALKPVIDSTWDWNKVNEAHTHMEQNNNAGKIVLRVH
ncbi:NAD(P)H-quinone oxidoreductase [Lederbergia lenta]|uniref:Putative zinc-dependent NADPH:quinone oxidoreductase n=1 Tax=Lederbergia lenta TaxID=1467 RepID=A0A2X4WUJ8_LEDLE|nr:NAD(P)H-quinone oxidoreductase [Lederbergia lenta]MCM3112196.1 NAD(P)H-quinone oxidoreductase [Lederbergia lenta]MEC2323363.1 NAD(P)H-quinone oxidoreductase [Lederbergia lenta]SQI63288.1 putative zinc-dependent NADPH:quinone oxidoreductase [Lederbergia lenta]